MTQPDRDAHARAGESTAPIGGRSLEVPRFSKLEGRQRTGAILVLLAGIGPGTLFTLDDDFARWALGSGLPVLLALMVTVAAVGGALASNGGRRVVGAVAAVLVATGGAAAVVAYVTVGPGADRDIYRIELALAFLVGALPGFFLYARGRR